MDILTLELFDVTVSAALKEINRAMEEHPSLPLRIHLGGDPMLQNNVVRFLERHGRAPRLQADSGRWRVDAAGTAVAPPPPAPDFTRVLTPLPAVPAPSAGQPPVLVTRSALGQGSPAIGRKLLLGILRELDSAPWLCLALDGLELLEDPQALQVLATLQSRGIPVRISRESQLFGEEDNPFEVMEDRQWQRLAAKGGIVIL
jgi:hypothetical protein